MWNAATESSVMTADGSPWVEDGFYDFSGSEKDQGCPIPTGGYGAGHLVTKICEIPGFDEKKFISAMGCTSNNRFVCWRKSDAT